MVRNDQSQAPLFPFKALSFYPLLSLLSLSILGLFLLSSPPPPFAPFPKHAPNPSIIKPHTHSHTTDECDLSKGRWTPDLTAPIYNGSSCRTLPDAYNCFKHGRGDAQFLQWRWKPHQCDLPRLDPSAFLKLVRGKRLAFVGDSLARNHMESLLCLLSQGETPMEVYKNKEGRFQTWSFPSSNFTLVVLWAKFLVKHEERLINGSSSGSYNLHIDQVDDSWASELRSLDYLVISVGHWLFRNNCLYNQTNTIGCVYSNEPTVRSLSVEDAMRMVLRTALSYIDDCEECGGVVAVVRTFSPGHFENGPWDKGGYCNRTRPYGEGRGEGVGEAEMGLRRVQIEEVERVRRRGRGAGERRFAGLDVTDAMLARPDGHPGSHWPGMEWTKGCSDCIHWCMPGPVDAWSDLLFAVLLRQ